MTQYAGYSVNENAVTCDEIEQCLFLDFNRFRFLQKKFLHWSTASSAIRDGWQRRRFRTGWCFIPSNR